MIPTTLDRYLLRRTLAPMTAVLLSTMVAFLMERLMRSFDLLSQTTEGFRFLTELLVNLVPHYVGLTLPGGFFIGLFVVVNALNKSSEIDAILASGTSLGRFAAPFVGLGAALMLLSVLLFGFIQPYSRYAYHAVLIAAENAGWNGDVRPKALLSAGPDILLTADRTDPSGRHLEHIFIRRIAAEGREDVLTAASAVVRKTDGDQSVALELENGRQVSTTRDAQVYVTNFSRVMFKLPLSQSTKLLRLRGDDVSELTLIELAQQGFGAATPAMLPRQSLLAEFYSRLARALMLPLLPLLAVPFGLSAKRAGSGSAMAVGGILLFAFETAMVLGQAIVAAIHLPAAVMIGGPAAVFASLCIATWVASRRRPGENPVSWISERIAALFAAIARAVGVRRPAS
ncbi:LptF/LptG family permease [Caulobacter sp. RHG1]|uniref:LptF/LptG family permease n=1 Tax=Caulobacter sp. (strain RHG1) TaxID=2545762 RepID=UPI0015544DC7|nr:LptF/LptG family permease [Caulobacter sp. RHG1]NQE61707.1 Lipopolysaccharide export system permease protein LptF [Caulobacter sp. RHG1]